MTRRPRGRVCPGRRLDERGAGTVLVVAMAALLLLTGCAVAVVAALVVGHRRAQAAADLGALAGAGAVARAGDGCAAARRVSARNGAQVTSCVVQGRDVLLAVRVAGPHWLGQDADLSASARAGPGEQGG